MSATTASEVPSIVQTDAGWYIAARCSECEVEMRLESEDHPGELAMKYAVAVGFVCEDCDVKIELAREREEAVKELDLRCRKSGLPSGLQGLKWSDMDRADGRRLAVIAAKSWGEHGGRLFLHGPYGTGKTRLAATAMWERLQHGFATFMSVPILLQAAFADPRSDQRRRAQEAMMGFGALVLDDLGKEKPGDWTRQILFGAIDSRVQHGSPIIITSNFSPDELAERLGASFGSRLAEFRQERLGGEDRRTA
jgi:DNA replication protein DnaC